MCVEQLRGPCASRGKPGLRCDIRCSRLLRGGGIREKAWLGRSSENASLFQLSCHRCLTHIKRGRLPSGGLDGLRLNYVSAKFWDVGPGHVVWVEAGQCQDQMNSERSHGTVQPLPIIWTRNEQAGGWWWNVVSLAECVQVSGCLL